MTRSRGIRRGTHPLGSGGIWGGTHPLGSGGIWGGTHPLGGKAYLTNARSTYATTNSTCPSEINGRTTPIEKNAFVSYVWHNINSSII